ncbi:hypothetical protein, partial [Priestia megaterium]|uniref:hypothetical protein n=1 Tax=Priestia megaterium TaxID=1404 RepID=UPI0035B5E183
ELATLVYGDTGPDRVRELYAGVVKSALERSAAAQPELDAAKKDQETTAEELAREMRGAMRWWNASAAACIIAFILAVNVVALGGSL